MPFPFLPGGAIVAAAVLFSAIAAFVAAMMAIDKAATRVFGGVVSGVVSGAQHWRDNGPPAPASSDEAVDPVETERLTTR